MKEQKLELKHLAPYLPYELQMYMEPLGSREVTPWTLHPKAIESVLENQNMPILRPLSDLKKNKHRRLFELEKELNEGGAFINKPNPQIEFEKGYHERLTFDECIKISSKLFEWHFDVFGLIEKNLAIDINTIKD